MPLQNDPSKIECGVLGCPKHDDPFFLDADWLRAHHDVIHYFGLGFIQLKLTPQTRMHFYTKELPAIVPEEDVHNHRYGFESHIVKGGLQQELFEVRWDLNQSHDHILVFESCSKDNPSPKMKFPCWIRKISSSNYTKGSSYTITPELFHRVKSDNCITFLHRGPVEKQYAHVVRTKGSKEVCPFSKEVPQEELWRIVKRML